MKYQTTNNQLPITNNHSIKFTLVELIVSLGVFSILTFALMRMFGATQKMVSISSNRLEVYESAKVALNMITRDLQCVFYENSATYGHDYAVAGNDGGSIKISNSSSIYFITNSPFDDAVIDVTYKELTGSLQRDNLRTYANSTWTVTPSSPATDIIEDTVSDLKFDAIYPIVSYDPPVPNSVTVKFDVIALADKKQFDAGKLNDANQIDLYKKTFRKTIFIANRYLD